jgi:molybdenum cofactor synthesis domain-containing protein
MKAMVLTISDRVWKGKQFDKTGPMLVDELREDDVFEVIDYMLIKDGYYSVREALIECVAERYSLVLTNGGTGIADRDETPEATKSVIDKEIVGISEEIRRQGLKDTPTAILTRGVAGISNTTLIVNLPGNPDGALSAFRAIKPAIYHALELIEKQISDCKESKYTKNS